MRAIQLLVLSFCFWGISVAAQADVKSPLFTNDTNMAWDQVTWPLSEAEKPFWGYNSSHQQAKLVLDDQLQTPEHHYLAAYLYLDKLLDTGDLKTARYYCNRFPPKSDHLEYRGYCLRASEQSLAQITKAVDELGEEAFRLYPDRLVAQSIYKALGSLLDRKGHIHAAIDIFQKSVRMTPPDQEEAIIDAKLSLAVSYANPLLSKALQRTALTYYAEVRDWYARRNPQLGSQEFIQLNAAIYNRGVAYLLNFQDYPAALAEFEQIKNFKRTATDAKVFIAYAQAKNQQPELARETLKTIPWENALDVRRTSFLKCYTELTERILGDKRALKSCFQLQETQTDVVLDLTATMAGLPLSMQEENQNLKMFYKLFTDHLQPDIQESLGSAITSADLEREKAESRLKSLQLKNMVLYQNLTYALLAIAVVCGAALVLAIRSWTASRRHAQEMSEGRARLQLIIDNVEEGLIRIGSNMDLQPQVSSHLLNITGGRDFKGQKLADLFSITNLDAGSIATALQSVQASLGENALAWSMNLHNLPVAARIQDKDIALYWQAETTDDIVQSLLLVIRDVTEITDLHRQTIHAQQHVDRILIFAREILAAKPKTMRLFMSELPLLMERVAHAAERDDTSDLKKLAHFIKGTARTLGLSALQNAMHAWEDQLKVPGSADWKTSLPDIKEIVGDYQAATEHVLGRQPPEAVETLFDLIAILRPGLKKHLQKAGIALGSFSVVEEAPLGVAELESLKEIILHGLTNAVDHGFILPKQQGHAVASRACFHLEIISKHDQHEFTIRDNGVGLNHQKIRELAARRQWQPGQGQTWSDFLFQEGVSTAENLSITSGRGVGLAAIYSASQQLRGVVKLLDNDRGPGGMIRLTWPSRPSVAA